MELKRVQGRRISRQVVTIQEIVNDEMVSIDYVFDLFSVNEAGAEILIPLVAEVLEYLLTQAKYGEEVKATQNEKQKESLIQKFSKDMGTLLIDKLLKAVPQLPAVTNALILACSDIYKASAYPYELGTSLVKIDDPIVKNTLVSSLDRGPLFGFFADILSITDGAALMANFQRLLAPVANIGSQEMTKKPSQEPPKGSEES